MNISAMKFARWDEVRRAQLHAELDAYYARLYGLTRDELRYIFNTKEVYLHGGEKIDGISAYCPLAVTYP